MLPSRLSSRRICFPRVLHKLPSPPSYCPLTRRRPSSDDSTPISVSCLVRQANNAYAAEVLATYVPGDQVLVHDYHLMLVPGLLRAAEPSMRIGWFLHVPWPQELLWRRLPARKQLLESLLCADLLGFQVHCARTSRVANASFKRVNF
jgi:hypothetical protein